MFQNTFYADESRRALPLTDTIRRYGLIAYKPSEKFVCRPKAEPDRGQCGVCVRRRSRPLRTTAREDAGAWTTKESGRPLDRSDAAACPAVAIRDGMVRLDGPGSGIVFHGGGMDGASTVILVVPAHRLVVVGLSSTMVDLPGRAGAKIIHRLVPGTRFEHELRGTILADIGLDDPLRPYRLRFHLSPTDTNRLAGPVSAWTFREGRAPDILPGYATLHRDGGSAPPRIAPAGARGL